jgi:lipoyl(octanoyl) transferase
MLSAPNIVFPLTDYIEAYDLGVAPYLAVQELQSRLRRAVVEGMTPGALLLLEHHPVITVGAHSTSTDVNDPALAAHRGVAIDRSERGGQSTLHSPGQLVTYPIMRIPGRDLRKYVHSLEEVLLFVLAEEGLDAVRIPGRPGLYLRGLKIASLGLRCERGVSSHGSALNVSNDLSLFDLVTSCGDPHLQQTSMEQATGRSLSLQMMKTRYLEAFQKVFGSTPAPLSTVPYGQVETSLGLPAPSDCYAG